MTPQPLAMVLVVALVAPAAAQAPAAPGRASRADTPAAYEPGNRRDPFVSLLRTGPDPNGRGSLVRPSGVAGLFVDEIALKGILESPNGFTALVQGPDMKTYVVHPGDRLMDGQVRLIARDEVVFLQRSADPLAARKDVDVRKRLRQVGDAKR